MTVILILCFPSLSLSARLGISLLLFMLGWWLCHVVLSKTREHDPHYIVIDEAVGMCITCLFLGSSWWDYALAFFFFRFFDIAKLWPASAYDRKPGAFAVMFDDVLMALPALGCLQLLLWLMA